MDSREVMFLIGFLMLGIAPVFAGYFAFGVTELTMLLGMVISTAAAFSKSI